MKVTQTVLDTIVSDKKSELALQKKALSVSELMNKCAERKTEVRDFSNALRRTDRISIIAEIKKASPSSGVISTAFDHMSIAQEYHSSGLVSAISVLTEKKHFQGDTAYISQIKTVTTCPVLRKDFLFDPYQIYESYSIGADAILLIVALLEFQELKALLDLTKKLKMHCLVEAHTQEEVALAVRAGSQIIGINARDLKTFSMNTNLFAELSPHIPDHCIKVAESGIKNAADIEQVKRAGADAALIGTSLMKAADKKALLEELLNMKGTL